MLQSPGHAKQPGDIERHECDIEADERAPEGCLAPGFGEPESEGLREPIGNPCKGPEDHAADDHIMKMRHEKHAFMQLEVRRRHREKDARHTADHESYEE